MNDPMALFARLIIWIGVAGAALVWSYSVTHYERPNAIPNPVVMPRKN